MGVFMIVMSWIVAYVLVGAAWSRTQAVRLQQRLNAAAEYRNRPYRYDSDDPWFGRRLEVGLGLHALGWPISMLCRFVGGALLAFTTAPVANRRAEVEALKAERETWTDMRTDREATQDARNAAKALVTELDEKIKRLSL